MEETIINRFENICGEWVCFHDENIHFPHTKYDPSDKPQIKLCGETLRIRANDAFSKLPRNIKEACVVHEVGHREYQHYLQDTSNPFYRMGQVMEGKVLYKELEADKYAVRVLGKDTYLNALDVLKNDHCSHPEWYSPWCIKELEMRIKAIKENI